MIISLCSHMMRLKLIGHTPYLERIGVLHTLQLEEQVKAVIACRMLENTHFLANLHEIRCK